MDKRWLILTCFFSMLTLITSIVCTSLIYQAEKNKTESNSNEVIATKTLYKDTSIIYEQNNIVTLTSIAPGYTITKTFSLTNNNSDTIKYRIEWQDITNLDTNTHKDKFTYSLKCSNGESKEEIVPSTDEIILDNLELKTNKSNECQITLTLNEDETITESYTQTFKGTYKITIIE